MAALKRTRTAVGAGDTALPAMMLAGHGEISVVAVTSATAATHECGPDTTLVLIHPDTGIYFARGDDADSSDMDLPAGGYAAYSVPPGAILAFRSISGSGAVKIMEA